jgi:hypothetical protein
MFYFDESAMVENGNVNVPIGQVLQEHIGKRRKSSANQRKPVFAAQLRNRKNSCVHNDVLM